MQLVNKLPKMGKTRERGTLGGRVKAKGDVLKTKTLKTP